MTIQVQFTKMHGLGNDFVVLDAVTQHIKVDSAIARKIAHRYYGIGCDQILIIEAPHKPEDDFYYRIFNADGTPARQCGNGARCVGRYVYEQGLTDKREIRFGVPDGHINIILESDDLITALLSPPIFEPSKIPIKALKQNSERFVINLLGENKEVAALSLGNPHCVINVPSVKEADVTKIGAELQKHSAFPKGVNVGFMQVLARNHIKLRVFERGAAETFACGTGACAAVIAGILHQDLGSEVKVDMRGGHVFVSWQGHGEKVALTGGCKRIFDGIVELELPKNG